MLKLKQIGESEVRAIVRAIGDRACFFSPNGTDGHERLIGSLIMASERFGMKFGIYTTLTDGSTRLDWIARSDATAKRVLAELLKRGARIVYSLDNGDE